MVPGTITVDGQVVQVAPPDEINELDLAADNHKETVHAVEPAAENTAPVPQAMLASSPPENTRAVGTASWILQILAALGGAVATGAVAWFLIGSAPARRSS